MNILIKNLHAIQEQITQAAQQANRDPNSILLLAVSKQQLAESVRILFEAGQIRFGENYVQEALVKIKALSDLPIEWHYIGHLQANKTRDIAEHFSWVHTIDRESIAKRLHDQRPASLPPLQVCIQVNFAGEDQKAGVDADEVLSLAKHILEMPRLTLRGLMVLPPNDLTKYDEQLKSFKQLADLQSELNSQGISIDTLSMGMTHDFKAAIAAGATIVRIGTAIFGGRTP
jgi:PLP dependent protein